MVSEIDENQIGPQETNTNVPAVSGRNASTNAVTGLQQSMRNVSRERWGDIYCNMPVKRMIALYDYDPQELSPNVDAEVCPLKIRFTYFILTLTLIHKKMNNEKPKYKYAKLQISV